MKKILMFIFMGIISFYSFGNEKLKIGVTLQPYYSFVSNIVEDKAEVIPIVRLDIYNSHNYSPKPEDIKRINKLDVAVINGIGHDSFVLKLFKVADNKNIKVIEANKGIKLMKSKGLSSHSEYNSHTFISITQSIEQIKNITRELGELDKENKEFYYKNSEKYIKKLLSIKESALKEIEGIDIKNFKVVTYYASYDYLFAEFNKEVDIVIEPAHGVEPSISHLKNIIEKIKAEKISVVFGEKNLENRYIEILRKETGVKVKELYHMTSGEYSKDSFEKMLEEDLKQITTAIKEFNEE